MESDERLRRNLFPVDVQLDNTLIAKEARVLITTNRVFVRVARGDLIDEVPYQLSDSNALLSGFGNSAHSPSR